MLKEYIAKKALDRIWNVIVSAAKGDETKLLVKRGDVEEALAQHGEFLMSWCDEISFRDLKRSKPTESLYIAPNFWVTPRLQQTEAQQLNDVVPMSSVLESLNTNVVILGQPGAGKTTFLKRLALALLQADNRLPDLSTPVIVRLHEVTSDHNDPLISHLSDLFALRFAFTADDSPGFRERTREKAVVRMLREMNALVLLDGYDEVLPSRVSAITADIQRLAAIAHGFKIVVTARTSSFTAALMNCITYELSPFDDKQIESFCRQFFQNTRTAADFLREIANSPFADVTLRPLNLAHLCAIYERGGGIPDKPKTVYRKVLTLLLEEWDAEKSIRRMSQYANFAVDRKREFLARLAFELTRRGLASEFGREHLFEVYLEELQEPFDLPVRDCERVATELETHTGIIAKLSTETFAFAHKSIHEFLAAEYIVGLPSIPKEWSLISRIPDELAIATAVSTNPDKYFSAVVFESLLKMSPDGDWHAVWDVLVKGKTGIEEAAITSFVMRFINRLMLERPDFTAEPSVALAAMVLYSIFFERGNRGEVAAARLNAFLMEERVHRSALRMLHAYDVVTTRREGTQLRRIAEPDADVYGPPVLHCPPDVVRLSQI